MIFRISIMFITGILLSTAVYQLSKYKNAATKSTPEDCVDIGKNTILKEFTLKDGTKCVVVYGHNKAAISCNWR